MRQYCSAPETYLQNTVDNTCARKKTNTLNKRGDSLLSYLRWHRKMYGHAGLPCNESRFYSFLQWRDSSNSVSATTLASLVASLNFAHYTIGLQGCLQCAESPRVKGMAFKRLAAKAPLKQRRVLLVQEVIVLERGVRLQPVKCDRVASGFFCAQLHSRARFSGLQYSSALIVDRCEGGGYLEFQTLRDKTQT